jgi:hypothetical protein
MGALTVTFVLITTFMVVEAIGGLLTDSLALLADAGHMLLCSYTLSGRHLPTLVSEVVGFTPCLFVNVSVFTHALPYPRASTEHPNLWKQLLILSLCTTTTHVGGIGRWYRTGAMQDPGCELPRRPLLLRTSVNRGRGRVPHRTGGTRTSEMLLMGRS